MSEKHSFGLRDKLGYLLGDLGNDFTFMFASNYLMIFYTKVLGISGAVIGVLFLSARIVDAFTDVTMGQIVDRLNPARDGRFRPWLRRMCLPVAIASSLMYLYFVQDWPYALKLTYVSVTYILWGSFCYTAINIPYGSMASVITPDAGERASLSTFRSVGASLAGLIIGVVVPQIVYATDQEGNQVVIPHRFILTAIVFGGLAIVCYLFCYRLCEERVKLEKERGKKGGSIFTSLGGLLKNRAMVSLVCMSLLLLLASLLGNTMNSYLFLDYFKRGKALSVLNFVVVAATLLVALAASKIATRYGKKEAAAVGMLFSGLIYLLLFFLKVKGVFVFMLLLFLATLGVGYFNMVIWALITDVIDYQEVLSGEREDGTVYAVYSFARKLGQALAGGVGGFALTAIGYVSGATVQTTEVGERIYMIATLVPAVCYLIVFVILQFVYPLNKKEVSHNTGLLQKQRQEQE
ncbi:MAG: glycoside-pentoside-hexuronide (GPH):cation symporter [Roseburia sp.]|nr:glycoside-pentoside-hexuronide (GPH):cation symporter [Roseburia sp.]